MSLGRIGLRVFVLAVTLACGACTTDKTATPDADSMDEWAFLQGFVPGYNRIWTSPPVLDTNRAVFAPVLGNGDMVACIGSDQNTQTFYIRKSDYWTDDGTGDYRGVREIPAGCLKICEAADGAAKQKSAAAGGDTNAQKQACKHEEDILNAEIRSDLPISGGSLRIVSYIAATENTLVAEISNNSPATVRVKAELSDDVLHRVAYPVNAGIDGEVFHLARETSNRLGARWISRAAMAARVLGAAKVALSNDASHSQATFDLPAGAVATVVTCMGGGKNATAHLEEARAGMAKFNVKAIPALKTAHRQWWKDQWWLRSYVRTYDDILDKHYFRSLYKLGTMCREGHINCGLHGPWKASDTKHGYSSYCSNDLGAGVYYLTLITANRASTAKMWLDTCNDWIPEGQRRAKADAHLKRGIFFPVHWAPWGSVFAGTYHGQKFNAAYASLVGNWYFKRTGDVACLRDRVYPFMRECADFYEDWLSKEADGKYHVKGSSHEGSDGENSCLDLVLAQILFTDIVKYSEVLGVDADRTAKWRDIRDHLNEFSTETVNGKTVYKADSKWEFSRSGNIVQVQIVYPGYSCNRLSDAATRQIGHDTIELATARQDGWGWTQDNMAGQGLYPAALRIGGFDVEQLITHFKEMLAKHNWLEHAEWVSTMSLGEFNHQLCVQAYDEGLMFFPDYPADRRAKFARLRTPGAFLVSGEFAAGQAANLLLYSEKGNTCTVLAPWGPSREVEVRELDGAKAVKMFATRNGDWYSFNTRAGKTYRLEKK